MSTDGDLSKGSGTDDGPDEFDSLVLDENFIRGGVSEASLRRYQVVREQKWERPPSRSGTAAAGSSSEVKPPGAGSASQVGPGHDPGVSGPTDPVAPTHLGAGERYSSGGFEHGRPRSTGILLGAAALVVALVVLTGLIRLGRGSAGSAGTGNLPVAAQAGPGAGQSVLLSPSVPAGSCFNVPSDSTATHMLVSVVTCSTRHTYELVDLQQGTGANDQYPTQTTWSTTVYDQCSDDLQTYTGESSAKWPSGLYPAVIPPTQDTWSQGNRTIYCVAGVQPAQTSSVRALGGSGATPTG